MSDQITLRVSPQVLLQASQIAHHTQQRIEEILSDWLETVARDKPVKYLSDSEVLALSESYLPSEQQEELSELLALHCEGELDAKGKDRLDGLMDVHNHGFLRKAQALREAVSRGLREPLQP